MISNIIYIAVGLIFILGGVLKWINLPVFEFQLIKDGLAQWSWVGGFSRLITGLEIILGILLMLNRPFRKYAAYAVLVMLAVFTGYLFYTLSLYGSSGNCGCFGEAIPLSTESSIAKNLIMIVLLGWAIFRDKNQILFDWKLPLLVAILVYSMMFIITPLKKYTELRVLTNPDIIAKTDSVSIKEDALSAVKNEASVVSDSLEEMSKKREPAQQLPQVTSVFSAYTNYSGGSFNPDEREKIIALFSLDCDHCLAAAQKMAKQKRSLPQLLILFLGEQEQVAPFFTQSGLEAPYIILPPEEFFPLLKTSPPRVLRLNRGNIVEEWNGVY